MKRFLVLYQANASAEEQMARATPEQAKAGMDAWMAWAGKAAGAIVELGAPLGGGRRIESGSKGAGYTRLLRLGTSLRSRSRPLTTPRRRTAALPSAARRRSHGAP